MLSYNINLRKIGIMLLIFTFVFTGLGASLGTPVSYADSSAVYVSSSKGNDTGDGSEATPYATLQKAYQEVSDGGTIYLLDDITLKVTMVGKDKKFLDMNLPKKVTITTAPGVQPHAVIRRGSGETSLIDLQQGQLTLKNIIIDGGLGGTTAAGRIINVGNAKLIVEDGAILRNNESTVVGSAIILNNVNSVVEMTGGEITGNTDVNPDPRSGAILIYASGATFSMSGGQITGNSGGGVDVESGGLFNLSGTAQITGNTLEVSGQQTERNVNLQGPTRVTLNGDFTGTAGITAQNRMAAGKQFGQATASGLAGLQNLIADNNPHLYAAYGEGNNDLVWKSQVGPGGLTDGLVLWLRPDAGINVGSGESVSSWEDQSRSANHASQSAGTSQPKYWDEPNNNVNFNPMLRFDGNDFLELDDKKLPLGKDPRTIVSVAATEVTSGNHYIISWGTANWYQMMGMLQQDTTGSLTAYSNEFKSDKDFWTVGVPNELFGTYDGSTGALYSKMNQIGNAARNWDTLSGSAKIGNIVGKNAEYWNGTIGDLIVFNRVLGDKERQRISTYLSLKYGYTLENTDYLDTNGATVWNATENSNYNRNIAGIGIDNKGALLQKQSRSTNAGDQVIVGLNQIVGKNSDNIAPFETDRQYLIWGDNGKDMIFSEQIGDTKEYRAQRTWKIQNTGEVRQVQVAIPVSAIPAGKKLLVSDSETDFTSAKGYELAIKDLNGVEHYVATVSEGFTNGQFFTYGVEAPNAESVTLEEVATGGNEIILTFDQEIDPQNLTKDGFQVTVGDSLEVVDISKIVVEGNKVKLTLSKELKADDIVNLEYKKPTTGNLKGTTGASVLDFSQKVTNNLIPLPTVELNEPSGTVNTSKPKFAGTATPDSTVTVKVTDNLIFTAVTDGNGNWSVTADKDIPEGDYTVIVTATKDGKTSEQVKAAITVKNVDKTALEAKVTEAGTLEEKDYTPESWANLERELTEANNVLNDPNATQDLVDTAVTKLTEAIDKLVKIKVDKTALEAKVTEVGTLNKKDYTPESWANLERELTEANNILNDPNATQDQVDAAVTKLTEAVDKLVKIKVDKTALEAKVIEVGTLDEKDYTPESWANLERELTEANFVLNDKNATQDQVDAAVTKLTEAIDKLVRIKVDKTALEAKVTEVGTLDKKDYTPESWANLERELTEANLVLNDPTATQDQVDQALAELQKALKNLVVMNGEIEELNLVGLTNDGKRDIELTPPFEPNQNKNYYGTVTNDVYGISLNPVVKYPDHTQVIITVNKVEYPSDKWNKLPLIEGENEIKVGVYNEAGKLINEYIFIIVRERASGNDNSGGDNTGGSNSGTDNPTTPPTPPTTDNPVKPGNIVTNVNGSNGSFATGTVNEDQATVTIDKNKLSGILADGKGHKLGIRVSGNGDVEVRGLTVEDLKKLADTGSSLEIEDVLAIYSVPAGKLDVNAISKQFGNALISDIAANIKIKHTADDLAKLAREKAAQGGYDLLVHPVDLDLTFMHDGKTDRAGLLKGYAPKYIALPEGIDPNRITTGVIINPDGSVFHVPTVVTKINNRYFALINDLRSSGSYSVIWNPKDFDDVQYHWGRADVNNIAARLSLKGNGDNTFSPKRHVTRSEFAEIIVLGLGLMSQDAPQNIFPDVPVSVWYRNAVALAEEFGIVRGYDDGNFKGSQQITREQGFAMIARAYRLIQSEDVPNQEQIASTLAPYADGTNVATWAQGDVAQLIDAGIIQGNGPKLLSPKAQMTRAEVTALIARMLKVTDLIDK